MQVVLDYSGISMQVVIGEPPMADCENVEKCPIFEKFKTGGIADFWILKYCKGNHEKCKRKELKRSGQNVPPNMLPNGTLSNAIG